MREISRRSEVVKSRCVLPLSKAAWLHFGFPKRPQHGKLIDFFRRKWLVELEVRLFAEFFIVHLGAYLLYGAINKEHLEEIIAYMDENGGIEYLNLKPAEIIEAALDYGKKSSPIEWQIIFSKRIKLERILDKDIRTKVELGCNQFAVFLMLFFKSVGEECWLIEEALKMK